MNEDTKLKAESTACQEDWGRFYKLELSLKDKEGSGCCKKYPKVQLGPQRSGNTKGL